MERLTDILSANSYPGRGIVVGNGALYYFIMGRSTNSRNRIFEFTDDGIRTSAYDPSLVADPSLIIYHPVRMMGGSLVITNGDQTDTIVEAGDFMAGCLAREYEPDAPNYTPRISAIVNPDGTFQMSILKRCGDGSCMRQFFSYDMPEPGQGYFLSTYKSDGDPLPPFEGEPRLVQLPDAPEKVWKALDAENKVSLYANIDGNVTLFNKNLGD